MIYVYKVLRTFDNSSSQRSPYSKKNIPKSYLAPWPFLKRLVSTGIEELTNAIKNSMAPWAKLRVSLTQDVQPLPIAPVQKEWPIVKQEGLRLMIQKF